MQGILRKMEVAHDHPVRYTFSIGDNRLPCDAWIDHHIKLTFLGKIYCIQCGRVTKKSFQQGLCYPCMQKINACGNCVLFPEKCRVEAGTCPTDDWAHAHCHADQIVYLANSSGLKVGVTRATQVPTRWIDQGAIQALPIFKAGNRYRAGILEVALKKYVNDKTNWRVMLKNKVEPIDMEAARDQLLRQAEQALEPILSESGDLVLPLEGITPYEIHYPVQQAPEKVVSCSLDRDSVVSGCLKGIKGQYLIFEHGVLNVRKFSGYHVDVVVSD